MGKRNLLFLLILLSLSSATYSQRRMVAEWEPAYGTLIRWPLGITGNLVKELATDDSLYVLVRNPSQQAQAVSTFQAYGVNLDHCRFIIADTYSHWTRDWGPHYVFDENGQACIADPIFNGYPWVPGCNTAEPSVNLVNHRGYEEDDAVNAVLAEVFGLPLISLPIYLTGGNVMTDGQGRSVSTRQMLAENEPICNELCFRNISRDSLGLPTYYIAENPEIFGIQHIDCYAKMLGEEKILVKQLPSWHPEYACVEGLAQYLGDKINCYGRKYEIVRIYCPAYSGNSVAAYTNSLIINKKVLVPLFGIAGDEDALNTYSEAMPGYEVIGFTGSWYHYDALHCRVMGIFDPNMLVMRHRPPRIALADHPVNLKAMIDDRSEAGLIPSSLSLYWRLEGNAVWDSMVLSPAAQADTFYAILQGFPFGTKLEYYFSAADTTGRLEKLPRVAPDSFYKLEITEYIIGMTEPENNAVLEVLPVPVTGKAVIRFSPASPGPLSLSIHDILGRIIWNQETNAPPGEPVQIIWDSGMIPKGCYTVRVVHDRHVYSKKIIKN